jgi:hypothetical protein
MSHEDTPSLASPLALEKGTTAQTEVSDSTLALIYSVGDVDAALEALGSLVRVGACGNFLRDGDYIPKEVRDVLFGRSRQWKSIVARMETASYATNDFSRFWRSIAASMHHNGPSGQRCKVYIMTSTRTSQTDDYADFHMRAIYVNDADANADADGNPP